MPLVISPHLDDAVLSCGRWMAMHPGCIVVTLFAGTPADASLRTGWDAESGFADAGEAVAARRGEDARALAVLAARPLWLDFTDGQYGPGAPADFIAAALRALLLGAGHGGRMGGDTGIAPGDSDSDDNGSSGAGNRTGGQPEVVTVLCPLGLFHPDHRLAHDACAAAVRGLAARVLWYEETPYRAMPGVLQRRLAELAAAGVRATPAGEAAAGDGAEAAARKALALAAYASQWRAFGSPGGLPDAALPERFWHLDDAAGA